MVTWSTSTSPPPLEDKTLGLALRFVTEIHHEPCWHPRLDPFSPEPWCRLKRYPDVSYFNRTSFGPDPARPEILTLPTTCPVTRSPLHSTPSGSEKEDSFGHDPVINIKMCYGRRSDVSLCTLKTNFVSRKKVKTEIWKTQPSILG